MNAVLETIKGRRSVRSYKDKPVPRGIIETIIDAGNWAPTGNNVQRWRFVVVQDAEYREKLTAEAFPAWKKVFSGLMASKDDQFREYTADFAPRCLGWSPRSFEESLAQVSDYRDGVYWGAPVIIFVIGTANQECAMACQNMMLAAHALGLGSCIVGFGAMVTGSVEIVQTLELKENEKIYGPVVIGYPKIQPDPPEKKDPVVKWV